jgi:hypothetical protein
MILYGLYLCVAILDAGKFVHPSLSVGTTSDMDAVTDGNGDKAGATCNRAASENGSQTHLLIGGGLPVLSGERAERKSGGGEDEVEVGIKDNARGRPRSAKEGVLWGELLEYLNPMDLEELSTVESSWWHKVCAGVKVPMVVVMRLSSPVVDSQQAGGGWCKGAVLVQVSLAPVLLMWCVLVYGWPDVALGSKHLLFAGAAVVGLLLAYVVHLTSRIAEPPPYHV